MQQPVALAHYKTELSTSLCASGPPSNYEVVLYVPDCSFTSLVAVQCAWLRICCEPA